MEMDSLSTQNSLIYQMAHQKDQVDKDLEDKLVHLRAQENQVILILPQHKLDGSI